MSRQRPDPSETPVDFGPLFKAKQAFAETIAEGGIDHLRMRLRDLSHVNDPATSVKAAAEVLSNGTVESDTEYLLDLMGRYPNHTMAALGAIAAHERGGDAYRWRLKLGRRTGPLKDAGLIHVSGENNGMSTWRRDR